MKKHKPILLDIALWIFPTIFFVVSSLFVLTGIDLFKGENEGGRWALTVVLTVISVSMLSI
jgi:hypothetical protein